MWKQKKKNKSSSINVRLFGCTFIVRWACESVSFFLLDNKSVPPNIATYVYPGACVPSTMDSWCGKTNGHHSMERCNPRKKHTIIFYLESTQQNIPFFPLLCSHESKAPVNWWNLNSNDRYYYFSIQSGVQGKYRFCLSRRPLFIWSNLNFNVLTNISFLIKKKFVFFLTLKINPQRIDFIMSSRKVSIY